MSKTIKSMSNKEVKTIYSISDEICDEHLSANDNTKHYCCIVPDGGGKRQWEKGGYWKK